MYNRLRWRPPSGRTFVFVRDFDGTLCVHRGVVAEAGSCVHGGVFAETGGFIDVCGGLGVRRLGERVSLDGGVLEAGGSEGKFFVNFPHAFVDLFQLFSL